MAPSSLIGLCSSRRPSFAFLPYNSLPSLSLIQILHLYRHTLALIYPGIGNSVSQTSITVIIMRFSEALLASAAAIPFVAAHGTRGLPKIWGMGPGVKRDAFGPAAPRHASSASLKAREFSKRQANTDGQCGPNGGGASCADGYCCSPSVRRTRLDQRTCTKCY